MLANYNRAIGDGSAFAKLKSRQLRGSLVAEGGFTAPLEIHTKAPDRMLIIMRTPGGVATVGFDGKTAWQKNETGLREMVGPEAEFLKRQARSFAGSGLEENATKLEIRGKAKLGERETFVVESASVSGIERLYFDAQTWLLLRQDTVVEAPDGKTPLTVEFEDYREVDGVTLPFSLRWSRPDFTFTQKFDEIKHNVAIDDAKFAKPAS